MRELERTPPSPHPSLVHASLAIVGHGRVGRSLLAAARAAGIEPRAAGRDDAAEICSGADAVLLCVPDGQIPAACRQAASALPAPGLVGHVSGATQLSALDAARAEGAGTFSIHPLQTFPDGETPLLGTPCAVAGSDAEALGFAIELAEALGMSPFEIPEDKRAAYHAAAAMASNLLIALEESAATLLSRAGTKVSQAEARELLSPLVLRTAANWAERGGAALTGPIARGEAETVERHRAAIEQVAPELLEPYDALSARAREVAAS